jgi:hypothetical protein
MRCELIRTATRNLHEEGFSNPHFYPILAHYFADASKKVNLLFGLLPRIVPRTRRQEQRRCKCIRRILLCCRYSCILIVCVVGVCSSLGFCLCGHFVLVVSAPRPAVLCRIIRRHIMWALGNKAFLFYSQIEQPRRHKTHTHVPL